MPIPALVKKQYRFTDFNVTLFDKWLKRGQYDACFKACNEAIDAGSVDFEFFLLRSSIRLLRGDCRSGWGDFSKAAELCPRFMSFFGEAQEEEPRGKKAFLLQGVPSNKLIQCLDSVVRATPLIYSFVIKFYRFSSKQ